VVNFVEMLSKELRAQASEFLKSRKNANNLINIISLLEVTNYM
jgi:hypothetical protein